MSKKTKRLKRRLLILRIVSFAVAVLPLLVFFFLNFGRYVKSIGDAVKLSAGGVVLLIMVALIALGKLRVPGRLVAAFIICTLCWLLSPLLEDLTVITTIWLVSTAVDVMIFSPLVGYTKRKVDMSESADTTADVTMAAVKEYLGRV